jgi:hypothetical protein
MKLRAKLLFLFCVLFMIASGSIIFVLCRTPIKWFILSEDRIRIVILNRVPLGADIDTCLSYIKSNLQSDATATVCVDELNGAFDPGTGRDYKTIGVKSIKTRLISQKLPWSAYLYNTYVSFGFDNKNASSLFQVGKRDGRSS